MTKSTRLQIRITPEKKVRGEELFESMGLTMSSAVNLFIEHSLNIGGLPFSLDAVTSHASRDAQQKQKIY